MVSNPYFALESMLFLAFLEHLASHRESKRGMKHSVKYIATVKPMTAEESPDPRANRERLLRLLSEELRSLPTLPASDANPEMNCEGYDEAVQLPHKHCAFKGCASVFHADRELRDHLRDSHYTKGSAVLRELVASTASTATLDQAISSTVCEAIATKIRTGAPLACSSIDRRALMSFASTLTDATTEALVCVSCACVYPRVATQRRHRISWELAMQGGDGKGGDDKFLGLLNHSETTAFFGFQKFLSKYGALANGPNLMASPFLEKFHS